MSTEQLLSRLVTLVCPQDATLEELEWAGKWIQTPLAMTRGSGRNNVSPDILIEGLVTELSSVSPGKAAGAQAAFHRLRQSDESMADNVVRLMYCLRNRSSEGDGSHHALAGVPIVTAQLIDEKCLAEQTLTRHAMGRPRDVESIELARSELERVSFGPNVTERDIVQDLVYVLQGIDGKYVKLVNGSVEIDQSLSLANHVESAIETISEMGVLYSQTTRLLSSRTPPSVVVTAFKAAIVSELCEYISLAALVDGNPDKWTLIKLLAWLTVPIRKLRRLNQIVRDVADQGFTPTHLLSYLYECRSEYAFRSVVEKIFQKTVIVWLDMLKTWLVHGELKPGTADDFFVQPVNDDRSIHPRQLSSADVDSNKVWHHTFELRKELVPSFLSLEAANEVVLIGKGVAFTRVCCKGVVVQSVEVDACITDIGSVEGLPELIAQIGGLRRKAVVETIRPLLTETLTHVKRFVLLGDGIFADSLMAASKRELAKPADKQNKFELLFCSDEALRVCQAEQSVFDRLNIALSPLCRSSDTGFYIFELDYLVPPPVDVIITFDALLVYRKCFRFMWQIIRAEHTLSSLWKDIQTIGRRGELLASVDSLIRRANIVRGDMWWFVHELRAVACYEVLDREFGKLESKLGVAACDLNQLIELHALLQFALLEGFFLNPTQDDLRTDLDDMFRAIVRFGQCLPSILAELATAVQEDEDVTDFRKLNMENLLADIHDQFSDAFVAFVEKLDARAEQSECSDFMVSLADRFHRDS